jgi:maltose-binding protein MalE
MKKILMCLSLLIVGALAGLALAPTEKAHAADSTVSGSVTRTVRTDSFCVYLTDNARGVIKYTLVDPAGGEHDAVQVSVDKKGAVEINGQPFASPPSSAALRGHVATVIADAQAFGGALVTSGAVAP